MSARNKQLGNRNFFQGISFRAFCFRLLNLGFKKMEMWCHMVIIRIPQAVYKIIKSGNTGSITRFKSTEDGVKRIYFKLSSPFS